jgi:DnaJ-class molecular chaperone
MENVTCSFCHGKGKNPAKEYPALFGHGTDNTDRRLDQQCPICKSWEIHYHKTCPSCGGKGYIQKWMY